LNDFGRMASPAKRRKIDKDSKSSPVGSRNLEYFFSKQKKHISSRAANGVAQSESLTPGSSELMDEQLAKKLQAEWDQEVVSPTAIPSSSTTEVPAPVQTNSGREVNYLNHSRQEQQEEDIYSAGDIPSTENNEGVRVDSKPSAPPTHTKGKDTLSLQSAGSAEDTTSSTIPFDESPLVFDHLKYVPDLQRHWATEGGDAPYSLLTRCFVLVNSTQSRIKIVDTLVNLLRTIIEGDPSSLLPSVRMQQKSNCYITPLPNNHPPVALSLKRHTLEALKYLISKSIITSKEILGLIFVPGMACYKFNISSLHISRARFRWLCDFKGFETSVWP
jgi:DNA ligase 1